MSVSGPVLAASAARFLPRFSPDDAAAPLLNLVGDASRPLQARIAAVDAVGALGGDAVAERMIRFLANEAQQVRAMALSHLARLARSGDEAAKDAVAHAVGIETFGNLKCARPQSTIIRAVYRTFDRAGDYFALAVKPGGVVQDLVAQKRPVLHKPKHFHPP